MPVQLRSVLSEEINRGLYEESGRLPSERSLAERFGVSRTSVRESLNALVQDGVLVRIVGKGTFIASASNGLQSAALEATGHLAFLIGENIFHFVQPGYSRVLVGAEQFCRQQGYRLLFHSVGEEEDDPNLGLPQGHPDGVQGCLVAGGLRKKTLDRLLEWQVPIVLTDLIVQDENTSVVGPDYASGTKQALEHLAGLGHTEIGFIGFPNSEKYQAYWQTLERLDLRYNPQFVHFLQLPNLGPGILAGYRAAQCLMESGILPSALVATNDLVAMGVIEALSMAGIEVPQRMSVIGFDDLGREVSPPLTTIRSYPEEVGRIAAKMLIDRLTGAATHVRVAVPTELLVRGSTAAPYHKQTGATR
ncbi:MAG: GntR family transcriptional regulator [Bryobacteraceae bacterium]